MSLTIVTVISSSILWFLTIDWTSSIDLISLVSIFVIISAIFNPAFWAGEKSWIVLIYAPTTKLALG